LNEHANIQTLRFDPLNDFVKVKIKEIFVFNKRDTCFSVMELHSNAMFIEGSTFFFGVEDPQITFKIQEDWGKIEKLIIDFEYLKKGREVYEEILKKCEIKMNVQDEAIKSIFRSRSWRITKPLRMFMELFRKETQKVS